MIFKLQSELIAFEIVLPGGFWRINHPHKPFLWLKSSPISLNWHDKHGRYMWMTEADPHVVPEAPGNQIELGSEDRITFEWDTDIGGLGKKLEVLISHHRPVMQWRFQINNHTGEPIFLDHINMLNTDRMDPKNSSASGRDAMSRFGQHDDILGLGFRDHNPRLGFYTNGWQSWNYSGTLGIQDAFPWATFGPLDLPMRKNSGIPKPRDRGHFFSDFFAVLGDRDHKEGFLVGFLSQRQAYGSIEGRIHPSNPSLRMWSNLDGVRVDQGQSFTTDWAYLEIINLADGEPLSGYLAAVAQENEARISRTSRVGWCSWYYAFESVSEEFVKNNLAWASVNRERIPLQVIQLDDGYETDVGDWFSLKETFTSSLDDLCSEIREEKFIPGIWLAPFVAKRRSHLAKQRSEWILRNRIKFPVNPGFLWESFPYVLDVTHPGVLDYLCELMRKFVHEIGFEYLKLDFLYAGALPGVRHNPSLTRAQGLYQALQAMRETAGEEVEILGCGCPLGSGIGIFDVMRIGPDVAPRWKPSYWGIEAFLEDDRGLPSTRNALLTTINRLPMHQRWWINDPDCLLIRSKETDLSEAEVQTLASVIAMSGGSLVVSDDLPSLSEERIDWLGGLIPPLPHAARALDWFDAPNPSKLIMDLEGVVGLWNLITLINWEDHTSDLVLDLKDFGLEDESDYHIFDFWNEHYIRLRNSQWHFKEVPPHGVRMLSLRPVTSKPQWLGDTLHISQGLILKDWQLDSNGLTASIEPKRIAIGDAWIALDQNMPRFMLDDNEILVEEIAPGIYKLHLEVDRKALLNISW
jgi:alpha-galactosidase